LEDEKRRAAHDALHALSCALGYNIRWLMRALLRKARKALSCLSQRVAAGGKKDLLRLMNALQRIVGVLQGKCAGWILGLPLRRAVGNLA